MPEKQSVKPLKALVSNSLENLKAIDILILPVAHLTSITDYMIICSGSSSRHLKALANHIFIETKQQGYSPNIQGEQSSEWILIDLATVVVHLMLPKTREFYNLEGLWQ